MTHVRDDMLAFFQNAHHLKDWLHHDPDIAVSSSDVKSVIDGSTALRLCADLCNGSKHFRLEPRGGRSGKEPKMGAGKIEVNFTGDASAGIWLTRQDIELDDGTTIDAIALGEEIISAWERALREWGVLSE